MSSHNNYKKIFDELISDLHESIPQEYKKYFEKSFQPVSVKAGTISDLFQKLATKISQVSEAISEGKINSYAMLSAELDNLATSIKEIENEIKPNKVRLFSNSKKSSSSMSDALMTIDVVNNQLKSGKMKREDATYKLLDKVWAQHREDGMWYRARITEVNEDGFRVKYFDKEGDDNIDSNSLCPDHRELINLDGDLARKDQIKKFDKIPIEENLKRAENKGLLKPDDDGMVRMIPPQHGLKSR